uniref:Uncharacterized protein n=1 Tax=Caenorhabditis japonica TaxID=281687 RepID=A0A8R1IN79_CAEJA
MTTQNITQNVDHLIQADIRQEDLLTDGPNNYNQHIMTEETTEVKKTTMGEAREDKTIHVKRYLVIENQTSIYELFMPIILFTFAIIFFIQSIIAAWILLI